MGNTKETKYKKRMLSEISGCRNVTYKFLSWTEVPGGAPDSYPLQRRQSLCLQDLIFTSTVVRIWQGKRSSCWQDCSMQVSSYSRPFGLVVVVWCAISEWILQWIELEISSSSRPCRLKWIVGGVARLVDMWWFRQVLPINLHLCPI